MKRFWQLMHRLWRLFIDDVPVALLLLGWTATIGVLSRLMHLGAFSGLLLFAGIIAITFSSFSLRR